MGGRRDNATKAAFEAVEALRSFAAEAGVDLLSVAIGGLAAKPAVGSVIAGATSVEQVRSNARAGEWEPSPDELRRIDEITASFA